MSNAFDFTTLFAKGLPAPAGPYTGLAKYHFVGGNNDPEGIPVEALAQSAERVLKAHGPSLAIYYPNGGPLGDIGLREFLAGKLDQYRGFNPTPDGVLVTSGSNHALDLICAAMLEPGDVVIAEENSYQNMLGRMRKRGATIIPVRLDNDGLQTDHLEQILAEQKQKGVTPKFVYTIPTVQNPTATVMPVARRRALLDVTRQYGVPVIEDECYADLLWDESWPDSLCAMSGADHVIHLGSFSKYLAPALRLGYLTAPPAVLSQMLGLKDDSGSNSLTQMIVADFMREHYVGHLKQLNKRLMAKRDALVSALRDSFGDSAEFDVPPGGIFLWIRLPEGVDTSRLAPIALAEGIAFNAGADWSVEATTENKRCLRLCFAHPSEAVIREGVAKLAQLCHREFDIAVPSASIA